MFRLIRTELAEALKLLKKKKKTAENGILSILYVKCRLDYSRLFSRRITGSE